MAIKSNTRFTHDPDGTPSVVLDYGDWTADFLGMAGAQTVVVIPGLRVAGVSTAARGNEQHTLTVSKRVAITSAKDATLIQLRHSSNVPKHTADIKIEIEEHTTSYFVLRNCTVESYPARVDAKWVWLDMVFKGGELEEIPVVP